MTGESGPFNVHLGRALQQARRATGLTQADVAQHLGKIWSVSKLGTYERGERNITVERLGHLVHLYNLDAAALISGTLTAVQWSPPVPRKPGGGRTVLVNLALARSMAPELPLGRFAAVAGPGVDQVRLDQDQLAALAELHGSTVDELLELMAPWLSEPDASGSAAPAPVDPEPC